MKKLKVTNYITIEIDETTFCSVACNAIQTGNRIKLRIPAHELPQAEIKYKKRNLRVL